MREYSTSIYPSSSIDSSFSNFLNSHDRGECLRWNPVAPLRGRNSGHGTVCIGSLNLL